MSAQKFFKDNEHRLDPRADPLAWNQNQGLLALAKQQDAIQQTQQAQSQELRAIRQLLERR